jgi:hypothetical protein
MFAVQDYQVGNYLVSRETELEAKEEAQQLSLELGIASYNRIGNLMPVVIYVDGWPYYPREQTPTAPGGE